MATLKNRPIKFNNQKDINAPENIEKMARHYDEQLKILDKRRIKQVNELSSEANTADIIIKINELLVLLNKSDFTED